MRRTITDPLGPKLYDLGAASFNAGKTTAENSVSYLSRYLCAKVEGMTNYFVQFTVKKNS